MPGALPAMLAPLATSGASGIWNGPSTVLGVAPATRRLLISSTSMLTPHGVGQQDELLALVVALLAGLGEEIDRREPFGAGRPHFADEGMQVLERRTASPRAGADPGCPPSASTRLWCAFLPTDRPWGSPGFQGAADAEFVGRSVVSRAAEDQHPPPPDGGEGQGGP
jgi:hypothetical protein